VGHYTFLEDIALADCAVEIGGRDLPDLFETAAVALASLMVDVGTVSITEHRHIVIESPSLDLLLYDWLSELIFLKDRDRQVFPATQVRINGAGPFQLEADARGGFIDPKRTVLGADPKAVTLHQFLLEKTGGGWRARLIIDI